MASGVEAKSLRTWSKTPVYVAGLDRGVRPIGDWSTWMTLSTCSMPLIRVCRPGHRAGVVDLLGQRRVEDVVDQRRLARAGDAGDRAEDAEREAHVDVAQVVLLGAVDGELAALGARAAYLGDRDLAAAGEVLAGHRVGVLVEVLDRAAVDDLAAVLAGAGADVDDPVGGADGVLVVLDDDQGVAEVLEPDQRLDEALVVALVEADRRLVEDVEDADQAGADLGGEPDALGLAAGQRARRAGRARGSRGRRRAGS